MFLVLWPVTSFLSIPGTLASSLKNVISDIFEMCAMYKNLGGSDIPMIAGMWKQDREKSISFYVDKSKELRIEERH